MTNSLSILLYSPLLIATACLLFCTFPQGLSKSFVRRSTFFYLSLLCWQICEILYYLMPTQGSVQFVFNMILGFVSLCSVFMFWTIVSFYRLESKLPDWLPYVMFAVPVVVFIFSATSSLHSLLYTNFEVTSFSPLTTNNHERGPLFWAHLVYSQGIIIAIAIIILSHYRNMPKAYRSGSGYLLICLMIYFPCTVFQTFDLDGGSTIDFNLIGSSLCGVFFYFAALMNGRTDYMNIEQREVFHYIDEAVFILDSEDYIVDMNQPALQLLEPLTSVDIHSVPFSKIFSQLQESGKILHRNQVGEGGDDVYILSDKYPLIYSMRSQPIAGTASLPGGRFVIMSDVTNNRLFMERLQEMVGVDALTGLANRYRYQELLREFDETDSMLLSIIMGDVNGLKEINDTYGHYEGDRLLRTVADTLRVCCPDNGYVARIGGDEFVILLPNCNQGGAQEIILSIHDALNRVEDFAYPPSIALGSATKTQLWENINTLIIDADMEMYVQKSGREAQA